METKKISLFAGFHDLVLNYGIKYAASLVKDCGFSGVEPIFAATTESNIPSTQTASEYREVLDANGLSVPCVSCGCSLVKSYSPDVTDMNVVKNLYKAIDFTSALGAPLFHHTLYFEIDNVPSFGYEDAYNAVLKGAELVADYAKKKDVKIIYEPQGFIFNGYDGFVKFYRDIKSVADNTGICFDVGNTFWVDEEPYRILDELANDVLHVHLKDYKIGCEDARDLTLGKRLIKEVTLGCGDIRIKDIVRKLKECGYSGFFSIEDSSPVSIDEKIRTAISIIEG